MRLVDCLNVLADEAGDCLTKQGNRYYVVKLTKHLESLGLQPHQVDDFNTIVDLLGAFGYAHPTPIKFRFWIDQYNWW